MPGCLNFNKIQRAGAVFATLSAMSITTVMAAPPVTKALLAKVEIFTTDAFPISGVDELKRLVGAENVTVYALDGVEKVEKEFPIVGAQTKAEAMTLGRKILDTHRKEIATRVFSSYSGLYHASFSYQITKFPAIIFDQRFVAYGERDAVQAMKRFQGRTNYRNVP